MAPATDTDRPADDADPAARLTAWLERAGRPVDRVVETHVSVLAFSGDDVFKMKKPVAFPFCDLSTAALRLADARNEVTLNSRLAPDVYHGVVDITDADGPVVDHAVRMRRLDDDHRLARLITTGDGAACVDAVADVVARFHRACWAEPAPAGGPPTPGLAELWQAGFDQWRPHVGTVLDEPTVVEVERLAPRYLAGRRPLCSAREAAGRFADGHGDLLADDIFCEPDGPRIIDCLEFDPALRWGDTLLDAAFLAMDLHAHGRPDLADAFLARYRRATGDAWPRSLADHYVAYRAHVRAKVACLRAAQGDPTARTEANDRLRLCADHLRSGRIRLVLVGGLPGTGKSTVAAGLAALTGATVVRTDAVRAETSPATQGDDPDRAEGAFGVGRYAPAAVERTYRAALERARDLLAGGEQVVIDASWSDALRRADARRVADEVEADVVELRCHAPADVCRTRIERRAAAGGDPSDATPAVHDEMERRFADWPDATLIDTGGHRDDAVRAALSAFTGTAAAG